MNKRILVLWAIMITGISIQAPAQTKGNIRGVIVDAASGQTLPYVTVVVLNTSPVVGAITDETGAFTLPALPVGCYNIQASYIGYEPATVHEVAISSAKETVLDISLKESIQALDEVTVRPKTNKEARSTRWR